MLSFHCFAATWGLISERRYLGVIMSVAQGNCREICQTYRSVKLNQPQERTKHMWKKTNKNTSNKNVSADELFM